jgi:hypothetical protein
MKEGLVDRIKSRGYWRVNFQPLVAREKLPSMADCRRVVQENSVSLRGWSYPAFFDGSEEAKGVRSCGTYMEGWVEWSQYREYWRMYKSGQWLHYAAIRLDWLDEAHFHDARASQLTRGTALPVVDTIYLVTEMFLLLSRLSQAALYDEGVRLRITAEPLRDRELWIDDPYRMPFTTSQKTGAERFSWDQEYTKAILTDPNAEARNILIALFDSFDWNPSHEQLASTQAQLVGGRE